MLNSTVSKASTNGSALAVSLPAFIEGKVLVLGQAFKATMEAAISDAGNTRFEWVDYIEVADEKEGKALLDGFAAKYEGVTLVPGKVHLSDVKHKVGKGGTAYTTGGNLCTTHNLDGSITLGGREYNVEAGATILTRSRNKVPYLCVTVSMKAILQGGSNGPKASGTTTPAVWDD